MDSRRSGSYENERKRSLHHRHDGEEQWINDRRDYDARPDHRDPQHGYDYMRPQQSDQYYRGRGGSSGHHRRMPHDDHRPYNNYGRPKEDNYNMDHRPSDHYRYPPMIQDHPHHYRPRHGPNTMNDHYQRGRGGRDPSGGYVRPHLDRKDIAYKRMDDAYYRPRSHYRPNDGHAVSRSSSTATDAARSNSNASNAIDAEPAFANTQRHHTVERLEPSKSTTSERQVEQTAELDPVTVELRRLGADEVKIRQESQRIGFDMFLMSWDIEKFTRQLESIEEEIRVFDSEKGFQ